MTDECGGLLGELERWKACPNLEEDDTQDIDAWIEAAKTAFAAGEKAKPDEPSQHAIAVRCHKARDSVSAAIERCKNGKKPKPEW